MVDDFLEKKIRNYTELWQLVKKEI